MFGSLLHTPAASCFLFLQEVTLRSPPVKSLTVTGMEGFLFLMCLQLVAIWYFSFRRAVLYSVKNKGILYNFTSQGNQLNIARRGE